MIAKKRLGKNGPEIGRLGYGAMVLEGYYGESDDALAVKTLVYAIEQGMMIDTADAYGSGHNEELVGRAIKEARAEAFAATKFGIVHEEGQTGTKLLTGWGFSLNINGTKEYFNHCLEKSLKALDVDAIDLMYAHYLDPKTPVEETVGAMAEAVESGKIKYIGLSNVTAEEVRRAHAIHPITAVQFEYSMWRREAEANLIPVLNELGIGLVCWSPLGAGFLTGGVDKVAEGDFRNNIPKFQGENLETNKDRFEPIRKIATEIDVSPAQLALSWLLHQGDNVFPIPGTRKIERINENNLSIKVELRDDVLKRLNEILKPGLAVGANLV